MNERVQVEVDEFEEVQSCKFAKIDEKLLFFV
jgi:hypothetical protein